MDYYIIRELKEGVMILLVALLLTIVIELAVAWIFKYRTRKEKGSILLINIITNPLANVVALIVVAGYLNLLFPVKYEYYKYMMLLNLVLIILIEVAVVVAEWKLLVYALKIESRKALKQSILMNLSSFVIGTPVAFILFYMEKSNLAILSCVVAIILMMVFAKKSEDTATPMMTK
jgi:MFS family permease